MPLTNLTPTVLTDLTPELARDYLNDGIKNRTFRNSDMLKYAADMKNGNWLPGSAFYFSFDGYMFDGAHRCKAVIESGVTVQIAVVITSVDFFRVADTGRNRTMAQMLQVDGYKNTNQLQAAVNSIGVLIGLAETGRYSETAWVPGEGRTYTMTEKYELFAKHPDLKESATKIKTLSSNVTIQIPGGWLTALRSIAIHDGSVREFDEFVRKVAEGTGLMKTYPEYLLRNKLEMLQKQPGTKVKSSIRNSLWVKAWNMAYAGETANSLKISPTHFPIPVGLLEWHEETH